MAVHGGSIFVTRSDSVLPMWNVMIPLDDVLLFVSAGPLSPAGKWSETISRNLEAMMAKCSSIRKIPGGKRVPSISLHTNTN
jgi:hypothetical protein